MFAEAEHHLIYQDRPYTTRLQKGGALVAEMRRLVLEWDDKPDCLNRIVEANILSLPSQRRTRDVIMRTFTPRFVRSHPPDLWRPVSVLERAGWSRESLLPIHYYAAASAEPLLWDFAVEFLVDREARGLLEIRTDDAVRFIRLASSDCFPDGQWSPTVSLKVARGLLAALRDFGILAGASKKRITPIYLPTESFAFLAMLRQVVGVKGRVTLTDPCWRLFHLSDTGIEQHFLDAHQKKFLSYHAAGSLVRLEFSATNLQEYAHELSQRAH
jgi:hypothetical protein